MASVQPPVDRDQPDFRSTSIDDLRALSNVISKATDVYLERLEAIGSPSPNLQEPFPQPIKDEAAQAARIELLRACEKVMALTLGPVRWLMFQNMSFVDPACIGIAAELGIPEAISPGPGPTSLDQLAATTGASKDVLSRVMRVCTQRLCFEEIAPGQYVHNGVSLQLLAPPIRALVGHCCDEGLQSAGHLAKVLRKTNFQGSDNPAECAFSAAFGTQKGLFDYFSAEDVIRGQRFAFGMSGTEVIRTPTEDIFPFESLRSGAKVVDVGGGRGHVSVRMAKKLPNLTFVVQDEEAILKAGQAEEIPKEVKDRIEFTPHDFFMPQPVKGADLYLLRFILHDHPDTACARILSHIVDAMDPDTSRILIDEAVVPGFLGQESLRSLNLLDMYLMMVLNGKERTESQWLELFKMASPRLILEKVWKEPGTGPEGGTILELRLGK